MVYSFVALGDSFTEGLDDRRCDGGLRGWADRFAERLAQAQPGLLYANLAVRGKMLGQVIAEQLPAALSMSPDLVSIAAGGNDLLRPKGDPDILAGQFDQMVGELRQAGCEVLLFTGFDPPFPVLRLIRGQIAAYNMHLRVIASRRQCHLADLWPMRALRDPLAWSHDRLHLTAAGHRRVAMMACDVMGLPVDEDWQAPWPASGSAPGGTAGWLAARQADVRWARHYAAPWVGRRVRGRSSGDGMTPKRPRLEPVTAPSDSR